MSTIASGNLSRRPPSPGGEVLRLLRPRSEAQTCFCVSVVRSGFAHSMLACQDRETDSSCAPTGFCGHQLPSAAGEVDVYIIAEDKWVTVQPTADPTHAAPGPRSVAGFSHFQSPFPALSNAVAVAYHGERDASNQGHAGAGQFWDDVWVLLKEGDDIHDGWSWQYLDVYSDDHLPEGRGWFPPAAWVDGHGDTRLVLFGGLLSSNERSDELWELEIN